MTRSPLKELIANRGFDDYQSGLKSRFLAFGLDYTLVYCEPTDKLAMYLEFESPTQLGRVTAWISGECEMEVVDKQTGQTVFQESLRCESERDFHSSFPQMVIFMRDSAVESPDAI